MLRIKSVIAKLEKQRRDLKEIIARVMREFNRTVNRTIADNAHRFVFAGCEALLRRLVKSTGIDQTERPVRFYRGTEDWLKPNATQIAGITSTGF
jgi:hypothetical protein